MRKNELRRELLRAKKITFDYFNENQGGLLTILDGDSRTYLKRKELTYNAVTPKYVKKYVLGNKYSMSMVHYILVDLFVNKAFFKTFYCADIKKVIFTMYNNYGSYNKSIVLEESLKYASGYYNRIRKDYYAIKSYLNSNKFENSNS